MMLKKARSLWRGVALVILMGAQLPVPGWGEAPKGAGENLKAGPQGTEYAAFEDPRYGNIPRLSYMILNEDPDFLAGEKFKGILLPAYSVKMPRSLSSRVPAKSVLFMARTSKGNHPVYVIVPAEGRKEVERLIKPRKRLFLVYTPITVHKGIPAVRLLENIGAEAAETMTVKTGIAKYYPAPAGLSWRMVVGRNVRVLEYEILEQKRNYAKGVKREIVPGRQDPVRTTEIHIYYEKDRVKVVEEGVDALGASFKQSDVVVKTPLTVGASWTVSMSGEERKREIVGVGESVIAGSREYKDVLVVREEAVTGTPEGTSYFSVTYYFFGAGVGFIGCKIDAADVRENLKPPGEIEEWFIQRTD
jgi:hypothetical protein